MLNRKNIILTGIPRSGTTLTCYLLNQLSDTVSLVEPQKILEYFLTEKNEKISKQIKKFFADIRKSILIDKIAFSKNIYGKIPDNTANLYYSESGFRDHSTLEAVF